MFAQGIHEDLVKRLGEQKNLVTASFEFLDEDARLDLFSGFTSVGHVEYLGLSFPLILRVLEIMGFIANRHRRYTTHLVESDVFPLGGLETDEVDESIPVLGILGGTKLENHSIVLCDQSPLIGIFGRQLVEQDQKVSQNDAPHLLHELRGLQGFTRDIEREVISIDDDLNPTGPLGEPVGTELGGDEDVLDHESDILLFQWTGLLPVGILAVGWVNANCQNKGLKYEHLFGEKEDTLERSASSISREMMPTDGCSAIFERGTVEI